jgi:phage-related tail protein
MTMPDETPTAGNGGTPEPEGGTPTPLDYATWIDGQEAAVRTMIEARDAPLRNALQQERDNAKTLTKQLKELSGKLDANSEAGKQIADLSGKLEAAEKRAAFVEQAAAAGCKDLHLAWLAARDDGLTVQQVKEKHPDLFAIVRPATNAGSGAGQAPAGRHDMNAYIRKAAGIGG